jgi:hypothetical protein
MLPAAARAAAKKKLAQKSEETFRFNKSLYFFVAKSENYDTENLYSVVWC